MKNEKAQISSFRTLPKGTIFYSLDGHSTVIYDKDIVVKMLNDNTHTANGRVQKLNFDMYTYVPTLSDDIEEPDLCFDYDQSLPYTLPTSIFVR
jgi:hypothetical protein